jgi:hypothetical protein
MWGEGASDLWGHLADQDAACLKAIRKRLSWQVSPVLDEEVNDDIARLVAALFERSDEAPDFMTVQLPRPY